MFTGCLALAEQLIARRVPPTTIWATVPATAATPATATTAAATTATAATKVVTLHRAVVGSLVVVAAKVIVAISATIAAATTTTTTEVTCTQFKKLHYSVKISLAILHRLKDIPNDLCTARIVHFMHHFHQVSYDRVLILLLI